MIKKKLFKLIFSIVIIMSFLSGNVAQAEEVRTFYYQEISENTPTFETKEIPQELKSGTIIKFINDSEYIILEEGEEVIIKQEEPDISNLSPEALEVLREEEEMIARIDEEAKRYPVTYIPSPEPEAGMIVTYNSLGGPKDIFYPVEGTTCEKDCKVYGPYFVTDYTRCAKDYKALNRGTTLANGVYEYDAIKVDGISIKNKITITSNDVLGRGVFSNFTDTWGEGGTNPGQELKKGDCATKGDIDNPRTGTTIYARKTTSTDEPIGDRIPLTKRDNGCMPKAVLDVWKTGVELFGYQWNKDLSFFARYYYDK